MIIEKIRSDSATLLSPQSEEALRLYIQKNTGIVLLDHQLENLRETVKRGCLQFGCTTAVEFMQRLQQQEAYPSRELEFLISSITVGESYFFREQQQIEFLRDVWLPHIISEKRRRQDYTLRLWSAGCAAGQELYTLAILLTEALPDIQDWNLHLLGTDINTDHLAQALHGRYTAWSLRATPKHMSDKYFNRHGRDYVVQPQLQDMVKFSYLNLMSDGFPSIMTETNALDLILCRNVFIYFDKAVLRAVMEKFANCLTVNGVLLLGPSDMVDFSISGLNKTAVREIICYEHAPDPPPIEIKQAETTPTRRPLKATHAIHPIVAPATRRRISHPTPTPVSDEKTVIRERIINLLQAERWGDVVTATDAAVSQHGEGAEWLQFKAKALANLGKLEVAVETCERSLRLNATNAHTYLLLALILVELNRMAEAETALRRTVFLAKDLVEAHFHLGLLLLRAGARPQGMKSLRNALELAEKQDPIKKLHNAHDMTFGRFVEILRNEIAIYEA